MEEDEDALIYLHYSMLGVLLEQKTVRLHVFWGDVIDRFFSFNDFEVICFLSRSELKFWLRLVPI